MKDDRKEKEGRMIKQGAHWGGGGVGGGVKARKGEVKVGAGSEVGRGKGMKGWKMRR